MTSRSTEETYNWYGWWKCYRAAQTAYTHHPSDALESRRNEARHDYAVAAATGLNPFHETGV